MKNFSNLFVKYLCSFALICGFAFFSVSTFAEPVTEDPLERQVLDIGKDLRCAVCQNQPISESNADLAKDMRNIIREQIQAGKSREEIVNYFVERYGDYVLMNPPKRGPGTVVWLAPVVLLLAVGISGFLFLRHRRQESLPPAPKLSQEDAALVRAARKQNRI
ncbi:cytochrome C biogenesis protein [Sulfuricaulis limicola]|uniref:Cytochrome c-type biogenesis protein n=1 Tax=Sulfuricaulis limicola TaxID=1620215 RepID=A0A1B4XEI5_9GAMM|nr:cytochrome c-type biogenesis protein [Sulfuricaulis limicola]BAV33206.1 cytochrome C biogenesis protein [Sulfuricaulis limicola]